MYWVISSNIHFISAGFLLAKSLTVKGTPDFMFSIINPEQEVEKPTELYFGSHSFDTAFKKLKRTAATSSDLGMVSNLKLLNK